MSTIKTYLIFEAEDANCNFKIQYIDFHRLLIHEELVCSVVFGILVAKTIM